MPTLSNSVLASAPRLLAATIIVTTTVLAASVAGAQTVPLQYRREALALMQVCRADYDQLCARVVPGGGRVLACLQSHTKELSTNCAQALPRAQSLRDSATASGVMPK